MIELRPLTDWSVIHATVTHDAVWPNIRHDFMPPKDRWSTDRDTLFMGVYWADRYIGCLALRALDPLVVEGHCLLLPTGRGRGREAIMAALDWIWDTTTFQRVVAHIPESNRASMMVVQKSGFERYGINPKSFMRDGQLQALHLFGISREAHHG